MDLYVKSINFVINNKIYNNINNNIFNRDKLHLFQLFLLLRLLKET